PLLLELGGKNALIALADADPDEVARAVVAGMNFTWCGQSCGSTSRAFIHDAIYDEVVRGVAKYVKTFKPGDPADPKTTMGSMISKVQLEKTEAFVASALKEGARLVHGGKRPDDPELASGFF